MPPQIVLSRILIKCIDQLFNLSSFPQIHHLEFLVKFDLQKDELDTICSPKGTISLICFSSFIAAYCSRLNLIAVIEETCLTRNDFVSLLQYAFSSPDRQLILFFLATNLLNKLIYNEC